METRLIHRGAGGWARGELVALGALAFLLLTTTLWWATALWPVPATGPAWLQAARAVCFGVAHDGGLPSAGGWILLVGEPLGMTAALLLVWRDTLGSALRRLAAARAGRLVLGAVSAALVLGIAAAVARVAAPAGAAAAPASAAEPRRLDRPAPPLAGLVDQHGDPLSLERFRGRPLLVTFAFAHCETVCPLLVHDALALRRRLGPHAPRLLVVTLDPWRDAPARLPAIARAWGLDADAFVAGGPVDDVLRVLGDWEVPHARDPATGDVAHPPVTLLVDAGGRLAWATDGRLESLLRVLPPPAPARRTVGDSPTR